MRSPETDNVRPSPSTQYHLIRETKRAIRDAGREGSAEEATLFWLLANKGKDQASFVHSINLECIEIILKSN